MTSPSLMVQRFPEKADKVNLPIKICIRIACQRFESGTSEAAALALSPDGSGILPQHSDGR